MPFIAILVYSDFVAVQRACNKPTWTNFTWFGWIECLHIVNGGFRFKKSIIWFVCTFYGWQSYFCYNMYRNHPELTWIWRRYSLRKLSQTFVTLHSKWEKKNFYLFLCVPTLWKSERNEKKNAFHELERTWLFVLLPAVLMCKLCVVWIDIKTMC